VTTLPDGGAGAEEEVEEQWELATLKEAAERGGSDWLSPGRQLLKSRGGSSSRSSVGQCKLNPVDP
jgi:hypothetical protein